MIRNAGQFLCAGVVAVVMGCGAGSDGGANGESLGAISATLTTVPAGVACVQVALTGGTTKTQNFTVSAGMTPVLLNVGALTPGSVTVTVRAFNLACSSVVSTSSPTWTGLPVTATITPGVAAQIDVALRPAVASSISVDFIPNGGASGSGGTSGMGGSGGTGGTGGAPGAGCRWNCTGSTCVQVALDNDGDGHGTTACVAAPGDDCDDSRVNVFPGANEICDGIDNDCDTKVDLSDGLTLVGLGGIQNVPSLNHASVGAIASDGTFGVVGTSPTTAGIFFGSISATGAGSFPTSALFPASSTTAYLDPHVAWGSALGKWGVVYTTNGLGGMSANAGIMSFNGSAWETVTPPGGGQSPSPVRGDVTARGQNDLLMVTNALGNLYLATQVRSGSMALSSSLAISGTWDTYTPRVAATGTGAGVIWQLKTPKSLNWSLISPTLQFGATEQLSTTALYADIKAINAGYGLAWVEGTGFRFMIKNATGATQCNSSIVTFGTVLANQQVAVSDSAYGNVVVATSPDSNLIRLYRFDNSCKLIDETAVSGTSMAPTEPRLARGGGHLLTYWTDSSGGHYRFLTDQICQ